MKTTLNKIYINRIILEGNGFDLAHGLKTRYEDFINWYFEQLKKSLANCNYSIYEDGFCKLQVNFEMCGVSSWKEFIHPNKHNISRMSINDFLKYLEYHNNRQDIYTKYFSLFELICLSISTKGWVDIESDYYKLLKECAGHHHSLVVELQDQLSFLQEKLVEYLTDVMANNTSNSQMIAEYWDVMYEPAPIDHLAVSSLKKFPHEIIAKGEIPIADTLLLDFNYTNTTNKYHNKIIHIHGKLDTPKSIIFGYGDELDENYKKLSNLNDNRYLMNMKSIRYLESGNYRDMLRFINAAPYQIYIMGHSCGNSDRTLLNTLFEHENCVSIKPFYYQKDDENDNYSEITQNISRNFTDMQSFRDKVVDKTRCEPMPQLQIESR